MRTSRWILPLLVLAGAVVPVGSRATPVRPKSAPAGAPRLPMVLPFIQDDYAKALAQARARKVPLFIEAWAPW
jgi:hypothetical protein